MIPERQASVLEAATALFGRFGFKKTSIADIAKRAGCSKAAIYLLAPSKTALYFQILHDQISRCSAESLAAIRVDLPAQVQLKELLSLQLTWIHEEPLVKALFTENIENTMPTWPEHRYFARRRAPMASRNFTAPRPHSNQFWTQNCAQSSFAVG